MKKNINKLLVVLILMLGFQACAYLQLTRYDDKTILALSEIKDDINYLYGFFVIPDIDQKLIDGIKNDINKLYNKEQLKGKANFEIVKQLEILFSMFERHVDDRLINGVWSVVHLKNNSRNINDIINIIIETESKKPKG